MTRNITFLITLCVLAATLSCTDRRNSESAELNGLSPEEEKDGWQLLFDGKTLNGWKCYRQDSILPMWKVEDGSIVCDPAQNDSSDASLLTTKTFSNFDLRFEWKISEGGNSGVLYHVVEDSAYKKDYETGPEYQILDDTGWKGEVLKPAQFAASNYDMYEPTAGKKLNPHDEWNEGRIIYNEGRIEHWLNGQKVVSFDEASSDFQTRYAKSKWVEYPSWNKFKSGAISLQEHEDKVHFRNIKIKPL